MTLAKHCNGTRLAASWSTSRVWASSAPKGSSISSTDGIPPAWPSHLIPIRSGERDNVRRTTQAVIATNALNRMLDLERAEYVRIA
jgi:hypothetical protein